VTITGGEPGMANEFTLNPIFYFCNQKIDIVTNGLFIEKGYYDKYRERIGTIYLNANICFKEYFTVENIKYLLLLDRNNIDKIVDRVRSFPHLEYQIKIIEQRGIDEQPLLRKEDIPEILKKLEPLRNIDRKIINQLSFMYLRWNKLNELRSMCGKQHYTPLIDIVNKTIHICYKSYTKSKQIPLTRSNLYKVMYKETDGTSEVCKNCTYIHQFMEINKFTIR
jgi:hypothetical protein